MPCSYIFDVVRATCPVRQAVLVTTLGLLAHQDLYLAVRPLALACLCIASSIITAFLSDKLLDPHLIHYFIAIREMFLACLKCRK